MKKMVRDITRAATGSGHRNHSKSSSQHQRSELEAAAEMMDRIRQLETELAAARDTIELQKEQLDKSLVEYTSALQRIVSLEKALESMKDIQNENEQLQERVVELLYEEQGKEPTKVTTQTYGDISLEEAARLLDSSSSQTGTQSCGDRVEGVETIAGVDYSNLTLIKDPTGSKRKWYGEAGLKEVLKDLVAENEQLKGALAASKDVTEEDDVNCQASQCSQLHRQIAELEQDAKYLADRERLAAKQHVKEKAALLEKITQLEREAAVSRGESHEASFVGEGHSGKRARTDISEDRMEYFESHILSAIEEHLTRRENHLDRALGFSIASRMLEAASSQNDSEVSWDTIAEINTRMKQLQQEVEIKTKLCDQLALRLADPQQHQSTIGLLSDDKAHLHTILL